MNARTIDPDQIELIAALRAGVPLSALVKRFDLDDAVLKRLAEQFERVPDEILLGIRRILKDNIGLKKIIADLVAQSSRTPTAPRTPESIRGK